MSRIPGRNFLFVPGPTNIPDRVQRAMVVAMEDHRSSRFPDLSTSVLADLKKVYKTEEGQVFIFPSSGTGAWEAALTNALSPGDKLLAARFGHFSHLLDQHGRAPGIRGGAPGGRLGRRSTARSSRSGVAAASEYWRNNDRVPKRKAGKAQQFYAGHSTGTMGG